MSTVPDTTSTPPTTSSKQKQSIGSSLSNVDLDSFLQLMIAEMQNQDPLDPTDSAEMLQQITQIREIGASEMLGDTLGAVLEGQNLSTASGLIGKKVSALSDDLENIEGVVERVSISVDDDGVRSLRVHIGEQSVALDNVRSIVEE